ncbi:MAG TPA: DEAD/DEAH box helicase, partial [Gammaproteobacteria bacterium]|nr:DEAD/DEAH box helicase [Gammaproteobacteria bacterium]
MNALANSQAEELKKFLEKGYGEGQSPLRFARFTGQDQGAEREEIRKNPPDILLTNYMMLELLLTRREDRELVRAAQGLQFLVFDELHTYRGRQGADIALLIRRCRLAFGGHDFIGVGTSATMASAGTFEDQQREVAAVAQTLFGTAIAADQVIGETLERATPERDFTDPAMTAALLAALADDPEPPATYEAFRVHPLASWIESTFGVQMEMATGRWIRQPPRRLRGKGSAVAELATLTGLDADHCDRVLRQFLTQGSQLRRTEFSRFPIFAFRLHQFFTRGDTVWTTLEAEASRYLSLVKQGAQPGEPEKPLFPLVFCRQCGAAYYRVSDHVDDQDQRRLLPREDRREVGDDGQGDAYLYLSAAEPWPRGDETARLARLPEFFKETTAQGVERVRREVHGDVPVVVFVDAAGRIVAEGAGLEAALIRRNFLFCLNPDCGVAYTKTQRSERGKLSTLGVDNRSTATTILAVRALIELQSDRELQAEARKLLSFTDNRQDASLQAGHFNDFAQVMLLRSALHQAMQTQGGSGLTHGELSRRVFEALKLPFADYAADPDVRGPARSLTDDALRQVIDYDLYRDLQHGWRWTLPNLEDCDLLVFDYVGLTGSDGLLAETAVWETGLTESEASKMATFVATPPTLQACPSELREKFLRTLLDVLRHGLAVKVDVLDDAKQRDWVEKTKPRLREDTVWYLEDSRELVKATVAYPRQGQREDRNGLFISSYGSYGRYLRRSLKPYTPPGEPFGRAEVDTVIRFLLLALKRYGIVEQVRNGEPPPVARRSRRPAPVALADPVPGYQINPDALRWLPGLGEIRPLDPTRLVEAGERSPEVNRYFVECYRHFVELKSRLEAREHTAQVAAEDRQDREDRFRTGDLPLLFCSPTMELGVDIAQLNVVNLRNVPPTPANYAQRSGRAGRGGQPALVYTYCAGRSPHDQYYYHRPQQMVAGVVAPPRIDLRNRDLVRSHLHALWMEVAKPDLGQTLTRVLDMEPQAGQRPLPIKDDLKTTLTDPRHRAVALTKAQTLLAGIQPILDTAPWFHPDWAKDTLDALERAFDEACERWRELYRAAVQQRELHHKIIVDHSRTETERQHSKRLRAQAESQIKLLTDIGSRTQGDFYSYRYFATEGFLPGYNFPRLPISAYVPARRQRGYDEFISRPRFLALAEFGPRALIYHEGAR